MHKTKVVPKKLDESEEIWRGVTRKKFPLFSNIEIDKKADKSKRMGNAIWEFFIDEDGEVMHTLIFDPKEVYNQFRKTIFPLYFGKKATDNDEETIEDLLLDVMTYLHFHELGHPMDAPYSKNDRKKVNKALFDGISEVLPYAKKSDILAKAANAGNMTLDMIVDDTFYSRVNGISQDDISNVLEGEFKKAEGKQKSLEDGVITIWDVIEISRGNKILNKKNEDEKKASEVYSISRIPYVMLFVNDEELREKEYGLFVDYTHKNGMPKDEVTKRAKNIFKAMIEEQDESILKKLGINKQDYYQTVDVMFNNVDDNLTFLPAKEKVAKTIYILFQDKKTRYNAVKGYIKPLADLIPVSHSPTRHAPGGAGAPADAGSVLEDIISEMDSDEANELLQQLVHETQGGGSNTTPNGTQKNKINEKAVFEFYKRNAKKIDILSPKTEFQTNDIGKEKYVELVSSEVINLEDFVNLDFDEITELQEEFGYEHPILIDLTPNNPPEGKTWQLNTYEWKEDIVKVDTQVTTGIEIPDNFVLIVDSSGSMEGVDYVGTGAKYDTLCRVVYGLFEGLKDASEILDKNPNVEIINFSDVTMSSGFSDIKSGYNSGTRLMNVLHSPQNGSTILNPKAIKDAEKNKKDGKTIYAFITDGEFTGGPFHDYNYATDYIANLAEKEGNSVVYIEIGNKSTLGNKLESKQTEVESLRYYNVNSVDEISDKLGHILIEYKR